MKKTFLCVLIIVILISGFAACTQPDDVLPEEITIQTDRDVYIPIMSSAVGIGLIPVYTLEMPPETIQFHWHTDYGYFVAWDSPDFKVNLLGTEVINNGEKIYWSYDPGEMGAKKPLVEISLQIEDATKSISANNLLIMLLKRLAFPIILRRQQFIKARCGSFLKAGCYMGICIESCLY